jgi:transposase
MNEGYPPERAYPQRTRTSRGEHNEVFVGLDVAKARHAVAVAEEGRQDEIQYLGEIAAGVESVRRLVTKLEKRRG